jgi:hypothetical protein
MPILTSAVLAEGAVVNVVVGWSASRIQKLRAALRPVPSPVNTSALLDTGADITCIDAKLVQTLGLPFGGTTLAYLPAYGGLMGASLHDISLTVLHALGSARNNLVFHNLTVLEVALSFQTYQILIGRDVLAKCLFSYSGPRQRFRLAY